MPLKIFSGIVAIGLLLGYLLPVVVKLKELALAAVVLIGIAMMAMDFWQSLRSRED